MAQPPRFFPEVDPDTRGRENTISSSESERIVIARTRINFLPSYTPVFVMFSGLLRHQRHGNRHNLHPAMHMERDSMFIQLTESMSKFQSMIHSDHIHIELEMSYCYQNARIFIRRLTQVHCVAGPRPAQDRSAARRVRPVRGAQQLRPSRLLANRVGQALHGAARQTARSATS